MDEPVLQVPDGTQIPLGELLAMRRAAYELAQAALSHAPSAKETVEAVMHAASAYGPQRGKAAVSAFLLRDAMAEIENRKQQGAIVAHAAPAQSVGVPGEAAPQSPSPGATAVPTSGPCQHPPDIACPNCAASFMEARNAKKKRGGARA